MGPEGMQTALGAGSAFPENSLPHQLHLLDGSSSLGLPLEVTPGVLPGAPQMGSGALPPSHMVSHWSFCCVFSTYIRD